MFEGARLLLHGLLSPHCPLLPGYHEIFLVPEQTSSPVSTSESAVAAKRGDIILEVVLSIAGSDSCGGAGIQADIRTFAMLDCYGMSVVTAVTAQNTCQVFGVHEIPIDILEQQLDAVFTDIPPDAVKVGMLPSVECVELVARKLQQYNARNVVLDPVLDSITGHPLMPQQAAHTMMDKLYPLCDIITPNLHEASLLCDFDVLERPDMYTAAKHIAQSGNGYVLVTGGHLSGVSCDDLLYHRDATQWLRGKRVDNPNKHGAGCTLSSAIAAGLAQGLPMAAAVWQAKEYVTEALQVGLDLGKGIGPLGTP